MRVEGDIFYNEEFVKQFKKLPKAIQVAAVAKEKLFRGNPLHPSLRLHKLQGALAGLWSISVTMKYRIIFEPLSDGDVLLISIGKHGIYDRVQRK